MANKPDGRPETRLGERGSVLAIRPFRLAGQFATAAGAPKNKTKAAGKHGNCPRLGPGNRRSRSVSTVAFIRRSIQNGPGMTGPARLAYSRISPMRATRLDVVGDTRRRCPRHPASRSARRFPWPTRLGPLAHYRLLGHGNNLVAHVLRRVLGERTARSTTRCSATESSFADLSARPAPARHALVGDQR